MNSNDTNSGTSSKRHGRRWFFFILPVGLIWALIAGLSGHHTTTAAPAAPAPAITAPVAAPSTAPATAPATTTPAVPAHGVTFQVTGPAQFVSVHQGSNEDSEPNGPLNLTVPLTTTPISGLYILTFATDAAGDPVTGKILVNGKVIGQCHASGPYAVAQTSIDNNDPSGTWEQS